MNPLLLNNKAIIITGAGSGIGRSTAITASQLGAQLILLDISIDGLTETRELLKGSGHAVYQVDLSNTEMLLPVIMTIIDTYPQVHGLVHCAGISSRKPLNVLSKESFAKIMDVNFYSFVELVKIVNKKNYLANRGSIVVMSSISSTHGYKAKTEYCVSKAAVDAFVRCMALELAGKKIRVNSIQAAEVLTPMALKAKEINAAVDAVDFTAPLGPSEPFEVANTICFLLSDATKTITGTSIIIDGGATI